MTGTAAPSKRNDRARRRTGWGGLFAWVAVAGFAAVLFCPPAQAADWSTQVSGETLACNVENISKDLLGRWYDIRVRYFVQGKEAAYQAYNCFDNGNNWQFTCTASGSSAWRAIGQRTVAVDGNSLGYIYLLPGQATQSKTCSELYSTLQIKITFGQ